MKKLDQTGAFSGLVSGQREVNPAFWAMDELVPTLRMKSLFVNS